MKSYLSIKQQYVTIKENEKSETLNITTRVAQGSILGPLLFILYINNLVNASKVLKFIIYANDISIIQRSKNLSTLIDTLNIELSKVAKWFAVNQLTLNVSKSNNVIFESCRLHVPPNVPLIKNGVDIIERVFKSKFLGVSLDHSLKFSEHILNVAKKLS